MQGVRGYPTIKALAPGSSTWTDYQGDRSAASLSKWATGLIGNAAVNIKKEADLDSFLAKCGGSGSGSSKGSKKDTAASWGLCLLLSSDKASMPSLWKALSVAFKGKVAFGFIGSGAQPAVAAKLGEAGKESKVVSVCNGDLRTAEAFKGGWGCDGYQVSVSSMRRCMPGCTGHGSNMASYAASSAVIYVAFDWSHGSRLTETECIAGSSTLDSLLFAEGLLLCAVCRCRQIEV